MFVQELNPRECPIHALGATRNEFLDYCASARNLALARDQASLLIHAMHGLTAMLAESRVLSMTPDDLASLMALLTLRVEVIQAHLAE